MLFKIWMRKHPCTIVLEQDTGALGAPRGGLWLNLTSMESAAREKLFP